MKQIKLLMVLLITAFAVSVGNAKPSTIKPTCMFFTSSNLQCRVETKKTPTIVEVYTSQIGVRELTGNNDGVQVEKYLAAVGLPKGNPWCAAFVKWCYLQANIASATSINGMALSINQKNNKVYYLRKFNYEPRAGDACTLYYTKLGRIGHTYFYEHRLNASLYSSVEGNTNSAGSREGDGVYRKYRSYLATYSINSFT
jgi:hypothetical protein